MDKEKKDLGVNPFVGTLEIGVNIREMKESYSFGEGFWNNTTFTSEQARKVSLYPSKKFNYILQGLTPMSNRLLFWLVNKMKYGEDYVKINHGLFMKDFEIKSYNTYKAALGCLIKNAILASTVEKGVYWVNPNFFFCGSRVNKYPNNLKVIRDQTES